MKNKDGRSLILLVAYVVLAIAAIGFGYLVYTSGNTKNYIWSFVCILAMIAIVILKYFYDVDLAHKQAKILRNVTVKNFDGTNEEKHCLVRVDEVDDNKVVVSVFKEKIANSDVVGVINND